MQKATLEEFPEISAMVRLCQDFFGWAQHVGPRYLPAPDFEARHLGGKQFLGRVMLWVHPDSMEGHDSYHMLPYS